MIGIRVGGSEERAAELGCGHQVFPISPPEEASVPTQNRKEASWANSDFNSKYPSIINYL